MGVLPTKNWVELDSASRFRRPALSFQASAAIVILSIPAIAKARRLARSMRTRIAMFPTVGASIVVGDASVGVDSRQEILSNLLLEVVEGIVSCS
jgi:hypothetical protein